MRSYQCERARPQERFDPALAVMRRSQLEDQILFALLLTAVGSSVFVATMQTSVRS